MYISEIAPADIRGRLVSFNQFAIILGMLVVYFVNWAIANGQSIEWINAIGWRYMFASEAIPAALFGILLLLVPETPRFLVLSDRNEQAMSVLNKIYSDKLKTQTIFSEIKQSVGQTTERAKLFSYGKIVIIIGILLSVFQQFVGINVALYYAPRIFESMGAAKDASMLQTIVMGFVNVVFTLSLFFR
jgi:SP family xylose:H+ symportor-like MFS transporter